MASPKYTDFTTQFLIHPTTGDLGRVTDVESIKRSIKNLLNTNKYERILDPNIGSNINRLLFEPLDGTTAFVMHSYIRETLENYEPRCQIIAISCVPDYDQNAFHVTIKFQCKFLQDPVTMTMFINRVR